MTASREILTQDSFGPSGENGPELPFALAYANVCYAGSEIARSKAIPSNDGIASRVKINSAPAYQT